MPQEKINERDERLSKLQELRKNDLNPYPSRSDRTHLASEVLKNFEKNANTLDANIKYWLNSDDLIALKNGLYTFSEQYKNEVNKDAFLEYAAGQLVTPSYLSLEYIMSKYQLLSEPVRSITSVTNKSTREYKNKLGVFRYYTINPKLFCGYEAKFIDTAPIMVATKSKAVFDYLFRRQE